jgi:hypothetical protein
MKAFGYAAGNANVTYSWEWTPGCMPDESGEGSFQQEVQKNAEALVGTLVPGLCNAYIGLISNRDIDIRLYDEDGDLIIGWVPGDTSQRNAMTKDYRGCTIEYSGYNGVGGNPGHEYIKIPGCTNQSLVMKVFGYQSGNAQVNYNWGP